MRVTKHKQFIGDGIAWIRVSGEEGSVGASSDKKHCKLVCDLWGAHPLKQSGARAPFKTKAARTF